MTRILLLLILLAPLAAPAQSALKERETICTLTSKEGHGGQFDWKMKRADEVGVRSEEVSSAELPTEGWLPAVVPGTVLNSLVHDGVYPEPYYESTRTGIEPHSRPLPRRTGFLHLLVPDGVPARPEGVRRQEGLAASRRHQLPRGNLAQRQHGGQHGRHVPATYDRHHRQGHVRPGEHPGREGHPGGHARHDTPQGRQVVRRQRGVPERRQRRDRPQRHPTDDRRVGLLLSRRHPRPQHRHLARHLALHHRTRGGWPTRS